jgi:steroid delta-isomerase-like uncharacterized protein
MLDTVKRHLAALSSSSWTEFRATLAPDAVFEEVPTGQRASGVEQCVASAQRWKLAFPDLRAQVVRGYTTSDRVIAEVEWTGTQTGPLDTGIGLVPPSRRPARLSGAIVFSMRGGRIVLARSYFDLMTLLAQLGISTGLAGEVPRSNEQRI